MEKHLKFLADTAPYGCTFLLVVGTVLAITRYTQYTTVLKIIALFLVGSLLIDFISKAYSLFQLGANIHLFAVLSLLEFVCITTYYLYSLDISSTSKKWFKRTQLAGVAIIASCIIWTFQMTSIDSIARICGHLKIGVHLIIILSILHLMLNQLSKARVSVITYGILIYYTGSIIIFLLLPHLVSTSLTITYLIWLLNALLLHVLYGTCCIELWRWNKS